MGRGDKQKKGRGGESSKGKGKSIPIVGGVEHRKWTDPRYFNIDNYVSGKVYYDVRLDDLAAPLTYFGFIIWLRTVIGWVGCVRNFLRVCVGERSDMKPMCGKSDKFVLADLKVDGKFPVQCVIAMDDVYIIGFMVDDVLYLTRIGLSYLGINLDDFDNVELLHFGVSYKGNPPVDIGFQAIRDCIQSLHKGKANVDELYFKRLCVIISEAVRYQSILLFISEAYRVEYQILTGKGGGSSEGIIFDENVSKLPDHLIRQILNWQKISLLWDFLAIGCNFYVEPNDNLGVKDAHDCADSIALLCYKPLDEVLKTAQELKASWTKLPNPYDRRTVEWPPRPSVE